jgi:hypothetical protein
VDEKRKGPAGMAGEAETLNTKVVSDYESPLSSGKVTPIPKYPVMALGHILMDPALAQGTIRLKGMGGTAGEGFDTVIEYAGITCVVSIHRSE